MLKLPERSMLFNYMQASKEMLGRCAVAIKSFGLVVQKQSP